MYVLVRRFGYRRELLQLLSKTSAHHLWQSGSRLPIFSSRKGAGHVKNWTFSSGYTEFMQHVVYKKSIPLKEKQLFGGLAIPGSGS